MIEEDNHETTILEIEGVNLTTAPVNGAGTGHPVFVMGQYDTAKSVAITDDFFPFQIYMKSSANATANDTSFIGMYVKVENITVDQPYNHMQAVLVNTRLNYDCFDAYAVQAHVTVATEMKTAGTNAHITGISGKAVMTAAATKGWVTAGLFILEGAALATEMCSVVSLVQEAGCGAAKEMLYINNDGTATVGIRFIGNFTNAFAFGTAVAPIALNTAGSHGVDVYISTTATSDTTYGEYVRLDANGVGVEAIAGRFKTLLVKASIGNAHGAHATLELDTSAGNVTGLGTGMRGNVVIANRAVAAGTYYGVLAELFPLGNTSALPALSNACLALNAQPGTALDLVANAISVSGTNGKGKMIYTGAPVTLEGSIRILVNGAVKYLPYYTTEAA